MRSTSRVINAPVLGFGQTRHAGFAEGKVIHYYEFGVASTPFVNVRMGRISLPGATLTVSATSPTSCPAPRTTRRSGPSSR